MDNFFAVLKRPDPAQSSLRTDFTTAGHARYGDAPCCEACGEYIGMLRWLPPFKAELETFGRGFGDCAFSTGSSALVSERFRQHYENRDLTGLAGFEPVEIVGVKRHRRFRGAPPAYYRVEITRSRAAVDQTQSGFAWNEPPTCSVCRVGGIKRWKRIILEPGTWSGEDIFIARGLPGAYMASARFKCFCEESQITNAVLIPAEEYERDYYPWDNVERARELASLPLSDGLLEKTKPNGERLRYCVKTNELVIISPAGEVQMLRPVRGIEYWNAQ